jgi:DNA-binding HxlR family transcriptional regulator
MARRTYSQYCPAAKALDVVGERWTLLIVRNLALGPQRYTDLLDGLPGLSPNVLAERLKHLETSGIVVKRELPAPAASTVYELTEQGVSLTDVVLSLARWGHQFMDAPGPDDSIEVRWLLVYLRSIANLAAAEGVRETYEFLIDDDHFHVVVDDGSVDALQGPSPTPPAVSVRSDLSTFVQIGSGRLAAADAIADGRTTVEGDLEAVARSLAILTLEERVPALPA